MANNSGIVNFPVNACIRKVRSWCCYIINIVSKSISNISVSGIVAIINNTTSSSSYELSFNS